MGHFVENRPISCTFCGYGPIYGKESRENDRQGNIIVECRWSCPKCFRVVRSDVDTIKKEKAE